MRELLGRAIHERFREEQRGKRPADAREMRPWAELDADLQESNRQQADDIPNKLRAIGCALAQVNPGEEPGQPSFTPEELNVMARLEHERWNQEKLRAGWRFGPTKDNQAKTTPYLVGFDQLPPDVQQWDVAAVAAIPDLLRRAGLRVCRLP